MNDLRSATWSNIATGSTVVVPVGSIEQHGPHLPLETDSVIATAVVEGAVQRLADQYPAAGPFLIAPTITYGASGEHQSFPGTSSIGTEALRQVVVELVRSLATWASRVVLVNGHGGNVPALQAAVRQVRSEGRDVSWHPCRTENIDAHAGYTETSLMLYLAPTRVRFDLAAPGNTAPLVDLMPAMLAGGVGAVSTNGVLGDPIGATADEGRRLLEAMVEEIADALLAKASVKR